MINFWLLDYWMLFIKKKKAQSIACVALDRFSMGTSAFEDPISLALFSDDCVGNNILKLFS